MTGIANTNEPLHVKTISRDKTKKWGNLQKIPPVRSEVLRIKMYTKSNSPWLNDSKLPYRQLLSCLKFINTVRNWLHFLKYKYDTGIPVLKISDLSSGIIYSSKAELSILGRISL